MSDLIDVTCPNCGCEIHIEPSAQPKTQLSTEDTTFDCISRQAVIEAINEDKIDLTNPNVVAVFKATEDFEKAETQVMTCDRHIKILKDLPSAQPTLYGYNIEHLELIARVLQKEDLPPERIVEALTDIGRIVAIVTDEFEETLRKAVEQCTI